jgi:hypothetical protein
VDDRLACRSGTSELLSTKPTPDNEVWPLILEKAFCIHAGGWDKIDGGTPDMALAILTGCTESYTVENDQVAPSFTIWQPKGGYKAFTANNWSASPTSLEPAPWLTGARGAKNADEFFDFLEECDRRNFVMCASTRFGALPSGLAPYHIFAGTGPSLPHLYAGTELTPTTSAPGLGSPLIASAPGLGSPLIICAGSGLTPCP